MGERGIPRHIILHSSPQAKNTLILLNEVSKIEAEIAILREKITDADPAQMLVLQVCVVVRYAAALPVTIAMHTHDHAPERDPA